MSETAPNGKSAGPRAAPTAITPSALPRLAPKTRAVLVIAVWPISQSPVNRTKKSTATKATTLGAQAIR